MITLVDSLLGQYQEYLDFAASVGWTPPMGFGEWYQQRDHDEEEPPLSEEEYDAITANDPDPICRQCGAECLPFSVEHTAFAAADGMIYPSWACPSCRLLWDDDQVFAPR